MKEIRFAIVVDDNDLSGTIDGILEFGSKGCIHSTAAHAYPDNFFIITDCNLEEANVNITTVVEVPEELINDFTFAEPERQCITVTNMLHELECDFEVPEVGVKFIYVGR